MEHIKKYYWLKLKEDFFDDKVIKYLRMLPEGETLVIIYLKMQLKSLKTEGFLRYDGIMPTCEDELALVLDEKPMLVSGAINALVKMGVVERWDNDVLYMKAMQDLIGSETAAAARVRKHRKMKEMQENEGELLPSNALTLPCNTSVTSCNTEIEIEKRDRDREDKEIEEPAKNLPVPPAQSGSSKSINYEEVQNLYNEICKSYPKCTKLNDARKRDIKNRFKSGYNLDDFKALFEKAEASDFMKGINDRKWKANFDWMITDRNMLKILEGDYDNKGGNNNGRNGHNEGSHAENARYGSWI